MAITTTILITALGLILIVLISKAQGHKWFKQGLESEKEIEDIQQKRTKIKVRNKEKKILREKLITAYIIIGIIWIPFYTAMFRGALSRDGIATWFTDALTVFDIITLTYLFINGFLQQMGTMGIRGKQKSETGRRTKNFESLLGSHHPLEPSMIKQSLKIWDDKKPDKIVWGKDGVKAVGDFYDLDWEDDEGDRRTLIHKDRATFMKHLSFVDVQRVKEHVDKILERRLGVDASIAQLVTQSLQLRMKTLDFSESDGRMFQYLIEGVHKPKEVKSGNGEPENGEHLKETEKTHTEKIKELYSWILKDRMGLEESEVKKIISATKLPEELESITRLVEDGIFFGGYHAEFARLYQYDTDYVIFVVPYPWHEAFSFSDRDWIDSGYVPFPLPYTDFDWRLLETVIIQISPKEFEACNILVPIYTDKDLRDLPGLIPPHPIDRITRDELCNFFVEESADELLHLLIEAQTALQRKERLEKEDLKLLEKLMRRLWMKIRNMRLQGIRSNLTTLIAFFFIGMFVMYILVQAGLFIPSVAEGAGTNGL